MKFSKLSIEMTNELSKDVRKREGIYFTPTDIVKSSLEDVRPHMDVIQDILEPSCGTGQFLDHLPQDKNVVGIELNESLYDKVNSSFDHFNIIHTDFLSHRGTRSYDLIIGNPPYYVMKKRDTPKEYHKYFTGRPNIFILFIIHSMKLLKPKGIISFVLPQNFTNGLWYNGVRKKIIEEYTIINITEFDSGSFMGTQQSVIILTIKKEPAPNRSFHIKFGGWIVLGTRDVIKRLRKLLQGSTTLKKDHTVSIGTITWNQHKEDLTNDTSETRLIYAGDIATKGGSLSLTKYKNPAKKNYIKKKGNRERAIIINRGYGNSYTWKYCLVEGTFLFENHVIVLRGPKLDSIVGSFRDPRTLEFIKLYFKNNAITATELLEILPIYAT